MPQFKVLRTFSYQGCTHHKGEVVDLTKQDAVAVQRFVREVGAPEDKPKRNHVKRPEVKAVESAKNTAITNDDKQPNPNLTMPENDPAKDQKKSNSKSKKSRKSKKVVTK
jgi:hypothetical protein